jgi:hypothetical protein
VFRWTDPDKGPVAGLEISRRGGEEAGPAIAEIAERMAPGHARSRLPASPAENSAT